MGQKHTKKDYENLIKEINKYNKQYHEENNSEISDSEFDLLNEKLKKIEIEHPEWISNNSPTKKIGGELKREMKKVEHNIPMLSIQDVFNKEDVIDWIKKVKNKYPDALFSVEHKIDGLSFTLRYEKGVLVLAETRGDGFFGEDVTLNALEIKDIVKNINEKEYLEIRGEAYIKNSDFEKYNKEQEDLDKKVAANPRNLAAGSLRQLNPKITADRKLHSFIFNIQAGSENFMKNHTQALDCLDKLGIKTIPRFLCKDDQSIIEAIDKIDKSRGDFDYNIDGAVIKIDQIDYRQDFINSNKYSCGHIAYKYPPEIKHTEMIDIEVAVGRTGKLSVTGILKPIQLCGTTVQRVTLHNQDFIKDKKVGIGGIYAIYKSGEIIPKLDHVVSLPESVFKIPTVCPVCKHPTVQLEGMSDIKCVNPFCPATLVRSIAFFTSREGMNIMSLGETYIKALIDNKYLNDYADIYYLKNHKEELIKKGIIGKEKNTEKILMAIEASKKNNAINLLTALGIPNVGKSTAKLIMKKYQNILDLKKATIDELLEIDDIGDITAKTIISFFKDDKNKIVLDKLIKENVNMNVISNKVKNTFISGKTFCITGTLTVSRKEIEKEIETNGGIITGFSKKLDYLVAGNNAGSKLEKAQFLNIPTISEDDLKNMIN